MYKQISTLLRKQIEYSVRRTRNLSRSSELHNPKTYEGDGKTTVNILNREEELGLMIDGFSQVGFRLNNDFTVLGSMIIFPRSVLSWSVNDLEEVNENSLSLFTILEPRIDILVLGIGDKVKDFNFYRHIQPTLKKHRISVEILPTEQACATFNFLNAEGRYVVGAMIPPKLIETTDDDLLKTKLRYQNLYET